MSQYHQGDEKNHETRLGSKLIAKSCGDRRRHSSAKKFLGLTVPLPETITSVPLFLHAEDIYQYRILDITRKKFFFFLKTFGIIKVIYKKSRDILAGLPVLGQGKMVLNYKRVALDWA